MQGQVAQRNIDVSRQAQRFPGVAGIVTKIDQGRISEIRVRFANPGVIGPVEFVVTRGHIDFGSARKLAKKGSADAVLLPAPDILAGISALAVFSRGPRVDQETVVRFCECEQLEGPVVTERHVQLQLAVEIVVRPRLGGHAPFEQSRLRARAHEFHGAADVGSTVQDTLRALQHFDTLEIAEAG